MTETNAFTGQNSRLLTALRSSMKTASSIDLIISFLKVSGVKLLVEDFKEAIARNIPIRILTSNYLSITEPWGLQILKNECPQIDLRFCSQTEIAFHPKACLFQQKRGLEMYIGSSNLSYSALVSGIEWNYRLHEKEDPAAVAHFQAEFEDLFENHSLVITKEVLEAYTASWTKPKIPDADLFDRLPKADQAIEPRGVQIEALYALKDAREQGMEKALVQAATGIGKTYLAAFDSKAYARVLFLAHRKEILLQAAHSFHLIRPEDSSGFFDQDQKATDTQLLFASVATLGQSQYLNPACFAPDAFDYIVVDEFHHAVSSTYQRILDYFKPKFLLGLTATPERLDQKDVFALCDYNVPYTITLQEAINKGVLCPFHYYGIYDQTDYEVLPSVRTYTSTQLDSLYLFNEKRMELIFRHYQKRGGKKTIAFCASKAHAHQMTDYFNEHHVPSAVLVSGSGSSKERTRILEDLQTGKIQVLFCVDMLNEGVDVPDIDTVLFLRPTQSPVIFLQQLGRGLRKAKGKDHLTVLDFIGNYKSCARIPQYLYGSSSEENDKNGSGKAKPPKPPIDCVIDFDLDLLDLFAQMEKREQKFEDRFLAEVTQLQEELGHVPSRVELFNLMNADLFDLAQSKGAKNPLNHYFEFLHAHDLLSDSEQTLYDSQAKKLIELLENTSMSRSYKMPVLEAFVTDTGIESSRTDQEVLLIWKAFFARNENWKDLPRVDSFASFQKLSDGKHLSNIRSNPFHFLAKSSKGLFLLEENGHQLQINEQLHPFLKDPDLVEQWKDIVRYRTLNYYRRRYLLQKEKTERQTSTLLSTLPVSVPLS